MFRELMGLVDEFEVSFFGDHGVVTPAGGSARPAVAGIFDRPAVDVGAFTSSDDVDGLGFVSGAPMFTCRTADLPAGITDGDGLVVRDADAVLIGSFVVREVRPDGTGMTVLVLEKAT
ncbi:head-tail joining protein [Methylobrevis pamukkalensis]|uniref:Phage Head-Tail Attachment n=1 Tax=Methylobrevis pamukkalensis TaxID=1439726 RepID=A0A1E3GZS2_9HYPH|nr:hypothetical protein [Methylobrevis pamukkalensis]ODN69550.1 hypothetical protein A6302_03144 [Methylobrevis pamukkalensis]